MKLLITHSGKSERASYYVWDWEEANKLIYSFQDGFKLDTSTQDQAWINKYMYHPETAVYHPMRRTK